MKMKLLFTALLLSTATILYSQVPGSPVLVEPPNLDIVSASGITLDWTDVPGALSYTIDVNTEANFSGFVIVFDNPTQSNYYIPQGTLTPNTTYYWHAKASNTYGEGDWSETRSFTTAANSSQECIVLRGDIIDLVTAGIINSGQGTGLNAKVNAALSNLQASNNTAAVNELNAFKNQVSAYINNERLSPETGNALLTRANFIIFEIGSGNSPVLEGQPVKEYALNQNYPNPFNPSTVISYAIPHTGHVILRIYDITGQEISTLVDGIQNSGRYSIEWNATHLSSGVYVYSLTAGDFRESKLMMLEK